MDYNTDSVDLVHLHAVEETLRYVEIHGDESTYDGLVEHLSWYWKDHSIVQDHKPQGWILEWIKCLLGE